MQIANSLNNCIRILFNPKVEAFKLFDFLIVKSLDDKYLAQIVEIYDDKFDSSQNVAKLRLFYKITENNEVVPYDNFTPNKECEIIKAKQQEIEAFINQDKETFIFGTNAKTSQALNVQFDFFNNNPIILADKVENASAMSLNLAKKLSEKKHVVIIDSTGSIEFENAKKISASKDFRLPFSTSTIDYIYEACLKDASLEFQAIGSAILNEIKNFSKKQESEFIPFNSFIKVLLEQYKVTPYSELKLLIARIKKHQMNEIFARSKKDKETLFSTIENNQITIVDLSGVELLWQKAYFEYIIEDLKQEIYLITRINDENFNVDLINKLYNSKKNISFVPNISYNYKKLPSLIQYCKNYVLLPTLFQRSDFLDANFALSNLITDGCILFGENTDNFLYLACDYELKLQEKRKNYKKIALSLLDDEKDKVEQQLGEKGDFFEQQNVKKGKTTDSDRLIKELEEFENQRAQALINSNIQTKDNFEPIEENKKEEDYFPELNSSEPKQEPAIEADTDEKTETNTESFKTEEIAEIKEEVQETEEIQEPQETEAQESSAPLEIELEEIAEDELPQKEEISLSEIASAPLEIELEEIAETETEIKEEVQETEEIQEPQETEAQESSAPLEIELEEIAEDEPIEIKQEETIALPIEDNNNKEEEEIEIESSIVPIVQEENEVSDLSEEELDFFAIAQMDSFDEDEDEEEEKEETTQTIQTPDEIETQESQQKENVNLSEMVNVSIDNNFEEIINTKKEYNPQAINIDENTQIDIIQDINDKEKENLPIFKEEISEDNENIAFSMGDIVHHEKYGRGTVFKTIQYQERQLLQIEFEESGVKLLDPKVAKLKIEQ